MNNSPFAPEYDATEKQINFLTKLLVERGGFETAPLLPPMTKKDASAKISELLDMPPVPKPSKPGKPTDDQVTEAGMYRDPSTGEIFKVQIAVHGSGKLYAKALVVEGEGHDADVYFEYAAGAIRKIKASWRMSLEEAKEFGALYGTCCVCGRTLTDEKSIDAGIGPVCGSRV